MKEFIRKPTKKETYGNKQDAIRKLSDKLKKEVVYMPYGDQGKGFYSKECLR